MVDDGYLIGYEDGNGDFVEVGRFNNFDETVTGPILLKHANSGETLEIDASGFDFTGPLNAPSATIDGNSSPFATDPHDNTQHSETYTTTAEDVENFSTSGDDGTVPTSQGDGTLTMESVAASDLQWSDDGNSPTSFTGSDSYTFTLADTGFDEIMIRGKIRSHPSSATTLALQVNGDTNTNYVVSDYGGNFSDGLSEVLILPVGTGFDTAGEGFVIECDGTWGVNWSGNNAAHGGGVGPDHSLANTSVTSPLTQFTLFTTDSLTFDIDVEVRARNLG